MCTPVEMSKTTEIMLIIIHTNARKHVSDNSTTRRSTYIID